MWDIDQATMNNGQGDWNLDNHADAALMMARGVSPSLVYQLNSGWVFLPLFAALADNLGFDMLRPYEHIQTQSSTRSLMANNNNWYINITNRQVSFGPHSLAHICGSCFRCFAPMP